jgi:hypothetical protein
MERPPLLHRLLHPTIFSRFYQPPSLRSRRRWHQSSALDKRPLPGRPTEGVQQQIVAADGGSIPWLEFWRLSVGAHGNGPTFAQESGPSRRT